MGRFLGITVKRGIPCRCLDGHVKEPYEMSMAWEPDRRFNFFNRPAHLCAVTYVTEISLNVTLNNHIHSFTQAIIKDIQTYQKCPPFLDIAVCLLHVFRAIFDLYIYTDTMYKVMMSLFTQTYIKTRFICTLPKKIL